jgi:hypothetical protein
MKLMFGWWRLRNFYNLVFQEVYMSQTCALWCCEMYIHSNPLDGDSAASISPILNQKQIIFFHITDENGSINCDMTIVISLNY